MEITLLGCWDTVGSLGIPDQVPFLPAGAALYPRVTARYEARADYRPEHLDGRRPAGD